MLKAGINLNPYQGLKQSGPVIPAQLALKAGINLNPYQGLKPIRILGKNKPPAGINLNPYQGLKPINELNWCDHFEKPELT